MTFKQFDSLFELVAQIKGTGDARLAARVSHALDALLRDHADDEPAQWQEESAETAR